MNNFMNVFLIGILIEIDNIKKKIHLKLLYLKNHSTY